MNTALPISITSITYLINIFLIILITRYLTNSGATFRRQILVRLFFSYSLVHLAFILIYYYFLKSILTSSVWTSTVLISLISFFIPLLLAGFLLSSKPFSEIKYPGHNCRHLNFRNVRIMHFINPLQSFPFIVFIFGLLVIIPYLLRAVILTNIGFQLDNTQTLETLLSNFNFSVIMAPFVEECLFRWFPFVFWGLRGLVFGSIIWFLFHPLDRIIGGISLTLLISTIPVWIPQIFFYIKLWRGKYYWTSFLFHSFTNLSILLSGYFLKTP